MFEAAELGRKMSKEEYETKEPRLRAELLQAHFALKGQKFPVIVIVSGADGAGKGELVHRLNEWLDPRGVETHAFWKPSEEERERPRYWRFWRAMPGRGRIGILFGSWYSEPIIRRVYGETKASELDTELDRIAAFEKMLADDGALIVKFWLHLTRKAQRKALKKLAKNGRLTPNDRKHFKLYDKFRKVSERALRHTDTAAAPWHVVEAEDKQFREFTVATILRDAIQRRLKEAANKVKLKAAARSAGLADDTAKAAGTRLDKAGSILAHVDLGQKLTDAKYRKELHAWQERLSRLGWAAHAKQRSMVMVFEGWDAAGKGSAIRRVTQALDPRLYRVVGIAAPTDEERAQHYLWRFWRHLPRAGFVTIFDRSWYGRLLVERVEGFAPVSDWSRAYQEINDFEEQLARHGVVLNKFWVHISQDEQLRRFKERQKIAHKQYKITEEDWRNRKQWDAYELAVNDMVAHTSTEYAPWTLVAGNDKKFARIQILKTVCQWLEEAL
jgi:AMP-polyphosphate phosphotransferase